MQCNEELAWSAGLVDGEGYFGFNFVKRSNSVRKTKTICLDVSQCDPQVLHRIQKALEVGNVTGPYFSNKRNHRPTYHFRVSGANELQFAIKQLWPWLSPIKREQATQVLEKLDEWSKLPKSKTGPKSKIALCHPERRHQAKGLCKSCYQMKWRRDANTAKEN